MADVYHATTNIASFLDRGAEKVLIVNKDSAPKLKAKYKQAMVIGESLDLPADFFDVSNSPIKIKNISVSGKTIIYMSANGTWAIEKLFKYDLDQIITVSFANMEATIGWLKDRSSQEINLVASGDRNSQNPEVIEDWVCMEILRNRLTGRKIDWNKQFERVEKGIRSHYRSDNFDENLKIILSKNRFPVVPLCSFEQPGVITVRDVSQEK